MFHVIPVLLLSTDYFPSLIFGLLLWEHLMSKHFLWIDVFYCHPYNRSCTLCFDRSYLSYLDQVWYLPLVYFALSRTPLTRAKLAFRRGYLCVILPSPLAIDMMSLNHTTFYQPTTPPGIQLECPVGAGHSRNASDSSVYSNDSSPWSVITTATSPGASPPQYHHGPTLLPKIRSQDVVIEPASAGGPQRHRRVISNTRNPPGFLPYPLRRPQVQRPSIESADGFPLVSPLVSPISTAPLYGSFRDSTLSSPVSITPGTYKRKASGGHARSASVSRLDDTALRQYGYPACRQLRNCVSQPQASPTTPVTPSIIVYPSCPQLSPIDTSQCGLAQEHTPAPLTAQSPKYGLGSRISSAQPSPVGLINHADDLAPPSTTLLSYLTAPTQAINLVRNVSVIPTRGQHDYFWWDVRNLRSWAPFSLPTFNSIVSLTKLLTTEIPSNCTPTAAVPSSSLSPDSESALVNLIHDVYAPRVNAALAVSLGNDHLKLYPAPNMRTLGNKHHGKPHFLANYASDTERTSSGLPRGRLVGVVKSYDRWNTGMRNEAPHRRVEYLNGLAHLQRCMREHSCRYGFIITEIELVCVRAGCDEGDDVPYFGFLELSAPIASSISYNQNASTSYLHSPAASEFSSRSQSPDLSGHPAALNGPMTASLALYFLMMLSKHAPLPTQPSGHLNVGGPGALTRQRILPDGKDKWIPEPQIAEKRDAKRARGWVMPGDAWHRREGGGVSRPRRSPGSQTRTKKWHK